MVFLGSDDRLLPKAVQINAEYLQADPKLGFVARHFRYINTDGSFQHENERHGIRSDYYVHFLSNNFIGMHGAVMYRRVVIEAVSGFDSTMRACEDYDLRDLLPHIPAELFWIVRRTLPTLMFIQMLAEGILVVQ